MDLKLFYDTETTGIPDWHAPSDGDQQPHIVQLAALLVDVDTQQTIQSLNLIVKPDGWEIPQEITDIHGITTEYAQAVGIPERQALETFLALWNGRERIAHNQSFDARIIRIATKRYSSEDVIDAWKEGPADCTGRLTRPILELPKMPKLSEACEHFGIELTDAHTAVADATACRDLYFALSARKAA